MESKERIVLEKIIDHASQAIDYSKGIGNVDDFERNTLTRDACCFNIFQIGELAKQFLSDETKKQLTNIPWEDIQGLRNRIVHGYASVKMNTIFKTIKNDLPELIEQINSVLNK